MQWIRYQQQKLAWRVTLRNNEGESVVEKLIPGIFPVLWSFRLLLLYQMQESRAEILAEIRLFLVADPFSHSRLVALVKGFLVVVQTVETAFGWIVAVRADILTCHLVGDFEFLLTVPADYLTLHSTDLNAVSV
jgi:hypothetical protein